MSETSFLRHMAILYPPFTPALARERDGYHERGALFNVSRVMMMFCFVFKEIG
jgi:hypothetical protein